MEITIKIELNEENMKKFADIFWAPALRHIKTEVEAAEEEVTPVDGEVVCYDPKSESRVGIDIKKANESLNAWLSDQKEKEDNFADKYKHRELEAPDPKPVEKPSAQTAKPSNNKHCTCYSRRPISGWSEFPEMLAKRLDASPVTKRDIADKIGVRYLALHKWETGESAPYQRNLAKLSKLFDWDMGYMLKLREEAVSK